ncbi:hypothetical protein NP493_286g02071 [Ridgeia piscesae]|uniref:C2H2-type domain-containing protein n=1 Tax=Ridgeia piscesae TaxID=27915 RepID=A0AAD9NWZ0_RIDPI|nr:hypothetical protein NP493_286g02071 [Ridgeia piscesae]
MAPRGPILTQVKKQSRTNNHKSQQSKGWQQRTAKSHAENSQNNYVHAVDILICGNCKQTFNDMKKLSSHKILGCRLRFACRCQHQSANSNNSGDPMHPVSLTCATCHQEFSDSWDLCRHCQSCHGIHIYTDSVEDNQSVTSDSVCSGGTSETQGSAGHSDVSTYCSCSYTHTVLESFSLPNFASNMCFQGMV